MISIQVTIQLTSRILIPAKIQFFIVIYNLTQNRLNFPGVIQPFTLFKTAFV
jgi:hypothetical protein